VAAGDGAPGELLERWLTMREGWPPVLVGAPDPTQTLGELTLPGAAAGTLRALASIYPLAVADLGFILAAGSMTLALLVLPMVIIAAREAIRAVPDSIRQGSLALGATRWQTIRTQVLPASVPGIATGVILAVSRALGETAPLLLVGATVFVTFDPTPFSPDGYSAMPVQIFNWTKQPDPSFQTLAAAAIIVLLVIVLSMNAVAIFLRNRYRQTW